MTQADSGARSAGDPVSGLSYTAASRELDDIVEFFEQRDVDVDQLVSRLERATALIEELDQRLRQTRMQVEQLVPRLAAVLESDNAPTEESSPASQPVAGSRPGRPEVGQETRSRSSGTRDGAAQGTRWRAPESRPQPASAPDATPELF